MDKKGNRKFHEDNKKVYDFVKSEHWPFVKGALFKQIDELQSVMNIVETDADKVMNEVRVRRGVIDEIMKMMQDIEGQALQYEQNELSSDENIHSHIIIDDEEEENV